MLRNQCDTGSKRYIYISIYRCIYIEKHSSLNKEMDEDIRKWKGSPSLWIGRNNIVKNSHTTKIAIQINVITIKISLAYFTNL